MQKDLLKLRSLFIQFPSLLFVPYLFFYLMGYGLNVVPFYMGVLFKGFHVVFLMLLIFWTVTAPKPWDKSAIGMGILFFLLLLIPGVYLEYPSDPWEHLRRIFLWNHLPHLRDNPLSLRISYFWAWTLVGDTPISLRRLALSLYAAFTQGLMTYQLYRLALSLNFDRKAALLQAVAFLGMFGTNLFGMRYYALSGTPIGYACYLSALELLLRSRYRTRSDRVLLFLFVLLMVFTHPQTSLFFFLSVFVLFLPSKISRLGWVSLLVGGIGFGFWAMALHPEWYSRMEFDRFTNWGSFVWWDSHSRYLETWGVHGCLAILAAPFFYKRYPKLVALTVFPIFLLLFPPSALLVVKLFHSDSPYRLLYTFPTSFLFTSFLLEGLKKIPLRFSFWLALFVILVFSLPSRYPWRGRLFFHFYQPPRERELADLEQTAIWFQSRLSLLKDCWLLTDDPTGVYLEATLGLENQLVSRLPPLRFYSRWCNDEIMVRSLATSFTKRDLGKKVCGILITQPSQLAPLPPSRVARSSRHWPEDYANRGQGIPEFLPKSEGRLQKELGMEFMEVPPNFHLFIPSEQTPEKSALFLKNIR